MAYKCGKGWTIECEHGRRYTNKDGIPFFAVVADDKHSNVTNHNIDNATQADLSNLLVDVLKVKTGCGCQTSTVLIDRQGVRYEPDNKFHYVIGLYNKFGVQFADDPNKPFDFFELLERAFSYITNAEEQVHKHTITIDGDKLPLHVYPGEHFALDIYLPNLKELKRGVDPKEKEELRDKPDRAAPPEQPAAEPQVTATPKYPRKLKKKLKKQAHKRVMDELAAAGLTVSTRESRQIYRNTKPDAPAGLGSSSPKPRVEEVMPGPYEFVHPRDMKTERGKLFDPHFPADVEDVWDRGSELPIILKRNGKAVRLTSIECLIGLIRIVKNLSEVLNDIQKYTPKVGWYFDWKLAILGIKATICWGFVELDNYEVSPYRGFGLDITVLDIDAEIGFGIKSEYVVAALFARIKGALNVKGAFVDPSSDEFQEDAGFPQASITLDPELGGKLSTGDLFESKLVVQASLSVELNMNADYEGKSGDALFDYEVRFGRIQIVAEIRVSAWRVVDFHQEQPVKDFIESGTIPSKDTKIASDGTPKQFQELLRKEIALRRSSKKTGTEDLIVAQNEHIGDWRLAKDELISVDDMAKEIELEIKKIVKSQIYEECYDFSEKSAEGLIMELTDLVSGSPKYYNSREWKIAFGGYGAAIAHSNFTEILRSRSFQEIAKRYIDPAKLLNKYARTN